MKELFQAYAWYNKNTNTVICSHLSDNGLPILIMPSETYFGTVGATLCHVTDSNLRWLTRMAPFRQSSIDNSVINSFLTDGAADNNKIAANAEDFFKLINTVDTEIVLLIDAIPENAFSEDFTMQFGPEPITKVLWQLLFQWFNHHTHHRGQISLLLDMGGIDNNFSLVLDKIHSP